MNTTWKYLWLHYLATVMLMALALGGAFGATLVYQYDNLLLLTTSNYTCQAFGVPGGAAYYMASAWAELCATPWMGAIAAGLLLTLGGATLGYLARGSMDRWSLGYIAPWIVAAEVFNPDFLVIGSTWLLVVGIAALWVRLKARPKAAWAVVVLAYVAGGALAMGLATGLVVVRLCNDRSKLIWVAVTVAIAGLTPWVGAYMYGLSNTAAYTIGASLPLWAVACSVITVAVGNRTVGRAEPKMRWRWVAFGLVTVCGSIGLWSQSNPKLQAMMYIEQASDRGNWREVQQRAAAWDQEYGPQRMVTFLRNTALCRQGLLLDQMFSVSQVYGPMGLIYDWNVNDDASTTLNSKLGAETYLNAGLLWQAHRLTYEAMVGRNRATFYTLLHLEAYNRALGRDKAAERFDHLLNHSLRSHNDLRLPAPAAGCDTTIADTHNLVVNLETVVASDTTHRGAFEYLTALYLSAGYDQGITALAARWTAIHQTRPIPQVVQQALLSIGHPFTPQAHVARRFQRFIAQVNSSRGNPQAISPDLHDTYWFYTLCLAQKQKQRS